MLVATFNGVNAGFGSFGAPPSNACGTGFVPDPSTGAALDPTTRVCTCPDGTTWDGDGHFCRANETASADDVYPDGSNAAAAAAAAAAGLPPPTTTEKVPTWVWVVAGGVGVLVVASIGAVLLRPAAPAPPPAPARAAFGRRRKRRR